MMKFSKAFLGLLAILAITFFSSCKKDDDTPQPEVVDFGTAPSSALITTGTVGVITENTVRYHTINFDAAPYTVTVVETKDNIVLIDLGPAPAFADELEAYVDVINQTRSGNHHPQPW